MQACASGKKSPVSVGMSDRSLVERLVNHLSDLTSSHLCGFAWPRCATRTHDSALGYLPGRS